MAMRIRNHLLAVGLIFLAGCGSTFDWFDFGRSRSAKMQDPRATPIAQEPAGRTNPAAEAPPSEGLSRDDQERIKAYLNRYPQDDLSRKVEGSPDAEAAGDSPRQKTPLASEGVARGPKGSAEPHPAPTASGKDRQGIEIVSEEQSKPKPAPAAEPARQPAVAPKAAVQTPGQKPEEKPPAAKPAPATAVGKTPESNKPVTLAEGPEQAGRPPAKKPADSPKKTAKPSSKPILKAVRIGEPVEVKPAEPPPTIQTNNPSTAAEPSKPTEIALADLIGELEEKVAEQPNDLAAQFKLRLLQIADGQTEKATAVGDGMNHELAEMLTKLFTLVDTARSAAQDPLTGADEALESLDDLRRLVRNYAQLRIPKALLCSRVDSYGVYQSLDNAVFVSGVAGQQAIVYTEVKNFATQQTPDGLYKTVLSQRLEILTPNSHSEWSIEEPKIVDVSRNAREDFFLTQLIELPANLQPGQYYLKVTIEDRLSNRQQEEIIEFSVRPPQVAQSGDEEG